MSEETVGILLVLLLIWAFVLGVELIIEILEIISIISIYIWDRRRKIIFFLILYLVIKLFIF
jgi:hypothetical protein